MNLTHTHTCTHTLFLTSYPLPHATDFTKICNAGFLVVPRFRGMGVATRLARSFVKYAPLLGYKASVFNLVYVNNTASVK